MKVNNIILCLGLIIVSLQQCPLPPSDRSVIFSTERTIKPETGVVSQKLVFKETFTRSLSKIPQLITCLSEYKSETSKRIQILIRLTSISQQGFNVNFESSSSSKWNLIKIRYLISTNQLYELGQTSSKNPLPDRNGFFSLEYTPQKNNIYGKSLRIIQFISSLDVQSQSSKDYGLKSTKIEIYQNKYAVWYQAVNSYVKHLQISIIIFDEGSPGHHFIDQIMEVKQFDRLHTLKVDTTEKLGNYLIGINSFALSPSLNADFSTYLDQYAKYSIQSQSLTYVAGAVLSISTFSCGICDGYHYLAQGECLKQCPLGTLSFNGLCLSQYCRNKVTINGEDICPPQCGENEQFNSKTCVCQEDYYRSDDICEQCPENTQYNYFKGECQFVCSEDEVFNYKTQQCSCKVGMIKIRGRCQLCPKGTILNTITEECETKCPEKSEYNPSFGTCTCLNGYTWNSDQTSCVQNNRFCGENQISINGRCECRNGYVLINNKCSKCPQNSSYNPSTKFCTCNLGYQLDSNRCVSKCDRYEVLQNGRCVCQNGYYRNSFNQCVSSERCADNEVNVNGRCQCIQNYERDSNGGCIPIRVCKANQVKVNGLCQCASNYQRKNGVCVPKLSTCPENEYQINFKCQCINGYYRNNYGRCIPRAITCPPNESLVSGKCECNPGYARNPDNRCYKIQCPYGQNYNYELKRCVQNCQNGYSWSNVHKKCVPQCKNGQVWNGFQCICQGECCPPGYKWNPHLNRCIISIQCVNNQVWDGSKCVCKQNYIFNGVQCIHKPNCGQNQIWNGFQCVCIESYQRNPNRICVLVCPPGSQEYYGKCVPLCPPNYYLVNGKCQLKCPTGYHSVNGQCQLTCKQNEKWNGYQCICIEPYRKNNNGLCVLVCAPGSVEKNGVCVPLCPPGYFQHNGQCYLNCKQNQKWNGYQCICPQPYRTNNQGLCTLICPPGSQEQNGKCVRLCPPGYFQHNGQCYLNCKQNEKWNGYQCICIQPYQRDHRNICVFFCPPGQVEQNGKCIQQCKQNEVFNGYQCICKPGYSKLNPFNPQQCIKDCSPTQHFVNGKCECKPNHYRDSNGNCIKQQCPKYMKYNEEKRKCMIMCEYPNRLYNHQCTCAQGFEKVAIGSCLPICKAGYHRGEDGFCHFGCSSTEILINGQCQCPISHHRVNGQCQKCPANAYLVNGDCYCSSNHQPMQGNSCPGSPVSCLSQHMTINPLTGKCECNNPYLWILGKCRIPQQCQPNSYWNGIQCVCKYGYYFVNGRCQDLGQQYYCPPNSYFNGVNCQCKPLFYPINGGCNYCPPGTSWTGNRCGQACEPGYIYNDYYKGCIYNGYSCKNNQYWNGATCVCKENYYWTDGSCSECPYGTYFDGIQCKEGQANKCKGPYSYWNGFQCVCIPDFFEIDGLCVTCPERTQWNGLYCKPKQGLTFSRQSEAVSGNVIAVQFKNKK